MFTKTTLGDVLDFFNGKAIKPGGTGPYPAYGSNGIIGGSKDYRYEEGIVIGRVGAYCGSVAYCRGRFWASDNTIVARPKRAGDSTRFFSYMLAAMNLNRHAGGAAQPLVTQSVLKAVPADVPDATTQSRIASILTAYDDLIENNTRRIAILEEMARRIYEEWFVRFRFPGHEGVRMVESELGLVPEGWRLRPVEDVAVVHRGRSYKGTELADQGGRPFINLKCMLRDGGYRASGLKRYTGAFKESQTVRAGEMVMAITDMTQERRIVARVGRVSRLDADFGVLSMDLVRIEARVEMPEAYLFGMFRWSGFADEVKQHANGANVLHLLPSRIEDYRFICPPSDLARRFAEMISPMLSLCDVLEERNTNLRTTRDLLLPKLISGELDVSELRELEASAA